MDGTELCMRHAMRATAPFLPAMRRMPRKMHLAFDISYIHMDGRWRMPHSWVGHTYPDISVFEEIARIGERG